MAQVRALLVRARWKCVILKVQLALQLQQLPTQQDNTAASEDDRQDQSWDGRYNQRRSAWENRILSDPDLEFEEFYNDCMNRCQRPFQTAGLIFMAVQEMERLKSDMLQIGLSLR